MTPKNSVIGICGRKYVGKDTVANYLVRRHGYQAVAFAAPLKQGLLSMFFDRGLTYAHLNDPALKEIPLPFLFGRTPRQLMTSLGTEWGQGMVAREVWVELLRSTVDKMQAYGGRRIVVTDCRFIHEEAMLSQLGAQLWYVQRDAAEADSSHSSETEPIGRLRTATLSNNGTLEQLHAQIETKLQKAYELHRPHHYSPV